MTGNMNVVVASHGSVPKRPFFPPALPLVIMVGTLVGLLLSFSTVVVLDQLDDSFMTAEDVEKQLDVPVLGSVPNMRRHRLSPLGDAGR